MQWMTIGQKQEVMQMSADNGIYILKAKDGYRVVHAQAIENLWWWDELHDDSDELNPKYIFDYFNGSKVFKTKQEALSNAKKLYNEIINSGFPVIEYGIEWIEGWEDKEFPTEGSDE